MAAMDEIQKGRPTLTESKGASQFPESIAPLGHGWLPLLIQGGEMDRLRKGSKVRIFRPGSTMDAVGTVKASFKEPNFSGWIYTVEVRCGYETLFDDELEPLTDEERIGEIIFGEA